MMATPWTCLRCEQRVVMAIDSATGERVLIDPEPVEGGTVQLLNVGPGLIAIDYVTRPAPRQPAHRPHDRSCAFPVTPEPVDLDDDPALEQSKGWRR